MFARIPIQINAQQHVLKNLARIREQQGGFSEETGLRFADFCGELPWDFFYTCCRSPNAMRIDQDSVKARWVGKAVNQFGDPVRNRGHAAVWPDVFGIAVDAGAAIAGVSAPF
ncbi:MAG: hypothetical protein IPN53_01655 [Comamonadaceae bacterium]|nr:hypothetical protein [Comamonadaceae bacterium]